MAAAIEVLHGVRRSSVADRRQASMSALISMVIALILINAPFLAGAALLAGMAVFFGVDAARYAVRAIPADGLARPAAWPFWPCSATWPSRSSWSIGREWAVAWTIAVAAALRIFGTAWNLAVSPVHTAADAEETVVAELGFSDSPRVVAMTKEVEASEAARASVDRGWVVAFVATLFAIHIGRMGTDRTLLGLLAPAVAVAGDMMVACLITLLVINPLYLLWRWPTRWIERPMWRWYAAQDGAAAPRWLPASRHGVAAPPPAVCRAHARRALLGSSRPEPGLADGTAARSGHRRDGSRLGHELVLRHRELGGRHVELVGGIPNRHLA